VKRLVALLVIALGLLDAACSTRGVPLALPPPVEVATLGPGDVFELRLMKEKDLPETFTVARLGVPPTLARTLRSTNCVESMIEIGRDHSANVKRWNGGQMALRWCAAGMLEARKQFRRVNGHLHLKALRAALDAHVAGVTPADYGTNKEVAA